MDFRGRSIQRFEVNGKSVKPIWKENRLALPRKLLKPENSVRIEYENEYDHEGVGFHHFKDPQDGEEYLYTNFEPFGAHRLFPCFDQPDLKATYDVSVTAPSDWVVIANSRRAKSEPTAKGFKRHTFETTKPFSTYLAALIVGPYREFRSQYKKIPLGFYCRKSLARHVDPEELFTVTQRGFDFYTRFFDFPYPFGKYDQVFVPEFNAGAMENVGAVTHSEHMVFRDPPTELQRLGRAETILHEMAHMWFGDLVTMTWWNDLWLNESFASYMATLCTAEATRFKNAWLVFNSDIKNWAYREDQLVTTHPIAGAVPDTDQTLLNFDGITYGKGASVLKQLVATIGMKRFRGGMRHYFKAYAFGNATLTQFLDSLERGSGRDLHRWAKLWLETSSLNTIRAACTIRKKRLMEIQLAQSANIRHPTLRPHHLEIAVGREERGKLWVESVRAQIDRAQAVIRFPRPRPVPAFVFPNHNDHAYAKVALDPASLRCVQEHLEKIEDPLLRQLLWQSLWNMTRDAELCSTDYLALVRAKLPWEGDKELIQSTLARATEALARFVPDSARQAESHVFFEFSRRSLEKAPRGDLQRIWARVWIQSAATPEDVETLARFADGRLPVRGLAVDQEMRWGIAAKCMAFALPGARKRLAAQEKRDRSDRGAREALRAKISAPDPRVKREAWRKFLGRGYGSLHLTSAAMSGFLWSHQKEILAPYAERFFREIPGIFRKRETEFARSFCAHLFPDHLMEPEVLARSEKLLGDLNGSLPLLVRILRAQNDDLARAIRCRALAAEGPRKPGLQQSTR